MQEAGGTGGRRYLAVGGFRRQKLITGRDERRSRVPCPAQFIDAVKRDSHGGRKGREGYKRQKRKNGTDTADLAADSHCVSSFDLLYLAIFRKVKESQIESFIIVKVLVRKLQKRGTYPSMYFVSFIGAIRYNSIR